MEIPEKNQGKKTKVAPGESPAAGKVGNTTSPALKDEGEDSTVVGGEKSSPTTNKDQGLADVIEIMKPEEPGEEDSSTERSRKEFFENTVIKTADVGKTLLKKIEETEGSADEVTELSETETQYLDDILFHGYVSHPMYLRKGFPIKFRSAAPIVVQRGYDLVAAEKGIKQKLEGVETCILVAMYLELYGDGENKDRDNLYLSHESKTPEEFESAEAIKERYEFVRDRMNSIIVDVVLSRLQDFLNLLKRISLARNIVNF